MIIENKKDFLSFINSSTELLLKDVDLYFNSMIEINNNVIIEGQNVSLSAMFIISGDVIFKNIDFYGFENIILNYSKGNIEFINCKFLSYSKGNAITLYNDSNSTLSIKNCKFTNFNIAINLNNNALEILVDSSFQNCTTSINMLNDKSIINSKNISNNLNFSANDSLFLKIDNFSDQYKAFYLTNELSFNNSFGRIYINNKNFTIDSKNFIANNSTELDELLKVVPNGSFIFLDSTTYSGNLLINRPLTLIGATNSVFLPRNSNENSAALIINSSFVSLSNISIASSFNLSFRDGIRFEESGGANCNFLNLNISEVTRRGISIWGANTEKIFISNCNFSNIKGQGAIATFASLTIKNSSFENCTTALLIKNLENILISENSFKYLDTVIKCEKSYSSPINMANNNFYLVKNLLET